MSERSVIFSAPMVRALLAGTKTQTRRVVRPRDVAALDTAYFYAGREEFKALDRDPSAFLGIRCPYGAPGDRLWVKETWRPKASARAVGWEITYAADGEVLFSNIDRVSETWRCPKAAKTGNVTPLFMPRWASRITLEVTGVRVERLCAISEDDAMAEGVGPAPFCRSGRAPGLEHIEAFAELWESINGSGSWERNPWVWVVQFRRVTP